MHKNNESYDKLNYQLQTDRKNEYLKTLYNGKVLSPIIPSPITKNYRHKAVLSATTIDKRLKLGLFEEGSKVIRPCLDSELHDKNINKIFTHIEHILNKYKITAYDIDKNTGTIKHVLIRKSYAYQTFLVVLVTNGHILPNAKSIVKDIVSFDSAIETITQNIQNRKTSIVLLEDEKVLYGSGYIFDEINQIKFRLSSQSFYQVNPLQMMNLYSKALELSGITKNMVVLDCYSGIGTITLLASEYAKSVIGIEVNKSSHLDALYNKKNNRINNVVFINDDVSKRMKEFDNIDLVVMDPTRDGASTDFLNSLLQVAPKRIVYISCEPITQIRDLKMLEKKYKVKCVHPFDMFPDTKHVECVALLERK